MLNYFAQYSPVFGIPLNPIFPPFLSCFIKRSSVFVFENKKRKDFDKLIKNKFSSDINGKSANCN